MEPQILDEEIYASAQDTKVEYAGFWIRVGASLIDTLVYLPFIGLSMYNLYFLKNLPLVLFIDIVLLMYKPLMEFKYGATLGKMAVKIKVVNNNLGVLSLGQSFVRFTPYLVSQVVSTIGTVMLFQNPYFLEASGMTEVAALQKEVFPSFVNSLASTFVLVCCIVVAFNGKKQGIHDMMASTYCIYK